jgi:hypothetical protein
LGEIEELTVAAALDIDVEHALDADRVIDRGGRGSGGR